MATTLVKFLFLFSAITMNKYCRSPMTRALLERLESPPPVFDHDGTWYCLEEAIIDPSLKSLFLKSSLDNETKLFLENCVSKGDAVFTQVYHSFAKALLSWFTSSTTINGLLGRGSMFVFSHEHILTLTGMSEDWHFDSLIDLGAGDGKITNILAQHANTTYVTESSISMRWRLANMGYKVLEIDNWQTRKYDVILALNLIDRVDDGLSILKQIRQSINPDTGRVVIALVLPYQPCIESGSSFIPVKTRLNIQGNTVEKQINSVVKNIFEPNGLQVERFTRLPYLCEGSFYEDYYMLTDIVFILKPYVPIGSCHTDGVS